MEMGYLMIFITWEIETKVQSVLVSYIHDAPNKGTGILSKHLSCVHLESPILIIEVCNALGTNAALSYTFLP